MTKKSELWAKGWGLKEGLIDHERFWLEIEKIEREIEKFWLEEIEKLNRLNRKLFWNMVFGCVWLFLAGFLLGLWAKFNI